MAWTYEQLFNALSNGGLAGQDSWSDAGGSGGPTQVEDTVMFEGAKGTSVTLGSSVEDDIRRAISAISDGSMYVAFRLTSITASTGTFHIRTSSANVMALRMPGPLSTDAFSIITDTTDVVVLSGLAADTWYVANIEFDDTNQNNKYRARIWKTGTGWSSFTAWSNTLAAYTTVDLIRWNDSSGDGGSAHTAYMDTITPTDPTGTLYIQSCSDALSGVTDSVTRTPGKSLTETLAMTDSANRATSRSISDTLAMTDSAQTNFVILKSIIDSLDMANGDSVSFSASTYIRSIIDAIAMSDSVSLRSLWAPRSKPASIWTPRGKS